MDKRRSEFLNADAVKVVRGEFLRVANNEGVAILGHCFMPDHVHLLLEMLCERCDLPRVARLMKLRAGFYFKQAFGRSLWQRSYFDRTLRKDEEVYDLIRYMFDNPVRAGLVNSPVDYPFLGAMHVTVAEVAEDLKRNPR